MPADTGGKAQKGSREARAERLEAELRANLQRRKEQGRQRARTSEPHSPSEVGGSVSADGATGAASQAGDE
jgi:hypothetical protein